MHLVKDRVKQTTTTTGTGTVALSGTVSGFQTFAQAFSSGAVVYYCIADGTNWEVGTGTYTTGSLSRDTILASSNSDAAVSWGVGTKDIFVTMPAAAFSSLATAGVFTGAQGKATNYSVASSDGGSVIKATAAITLTLPAASGLPAAWWVTLSNRATGAVQIARTGSDTVNGLAGGYVLRPGEDITVYRASSSAFDVLTLGQSVTVGQGAFDPLHKGSSITLTNNNLTATGTSGGYGAVLATIGASGGRRYFEVRAATAAGLAVGLGKAAIDLADTVGGDANGWAFLADGRKVTGGTTTPYGSVVVDNDVVGIAWDADAGKMWVRINGVFQGGGDPVMGTNPMFTGVTGMLFPAIGDFSNSSAASGTLIPSSFVYSLPTSFSTFY